MQSLAPFLHQWRGETVENDSRLRLLKTLELLLMQTDEKHPLTTKDIENALRTQWGIDAFRITMGADQYLLDHTYSMRGCEKTR